SRRHTLLPLRVARASTTGPMRHLRNADMGDTGGGDRTHVCRTNGVRGRQFWIEEADQGGEAIAYDLPTRSHRISSPPQTER
ncbi:MAG: hypothetical protein Q9198_011343, partial [Flavoplaca austrocitrina]